MLILQALGVLAVGWFLAWLFGNALSPLKRFPLAGVGLVVAGLASLLFVVHGYETGNALPASTTSASEASLFAAEHAGDPSANNAFLAWARNTMRAHSRHGGDSATYYLEPQAVLTNAELGQWSTYVLLPERATKRPSEAEWIVFYGVAPTLSGQRRSQFGRVIRYASLFGLAQRSDGR